MCFDRKDIIPPLKKVEPNRGFGFIFLKGTGSQTLVQPFLKVDLAPLYL
jgi:hypothetical protein